MIESQPPDQAVRDRISTNLDKSFLVEAGAGSGKTRQLLRRMVALVKTGHAKIDQIAAVTFTRKAAAELRERFQIVILDVSPENPDGVAALQEIRKADSDLCVIATSSNPSVGMAVKIMKHQAFHYLKKPVVPDELCNVVKDAIREKGLLVDLETRLNTAIGTRIRERRHSRPLTLKQLANRTGLSVSLISQIELGKSAASMSTLHKLATALQTDMTYFFETV